MKLLVVEKVRMETKPAAETAMERVSSQVEALSQLLTPCGEICILLMYQGNSNCAFLEPFLLGSIDASTASILSMSVRSAPHCFPFHILNTIAKGSVGVVSPFVKMDLKQSRVLVYEFKHSPGQLVTPHHHEIYEILYFLDGEGIIHLGHEQYPVNNDTMVLISPFTPHAVFADTRMIVLVLAFEDFLQGFPNSRELFSRVLNRPKYHHMNTMSANTLRDTFRKILYEQNHNNSFSDLTTQSHLLHLLVSLARDWETEQVADSNAYRASILRCYIDSHYFDCITSEDLASMLKLTPRHMNTIFKVQYGLTPMQYLNDVRINHAKALLSDTDKEIVSICFETGFEAVSTFYRTFKNKVGVSPQQYRKTFEV